jgi:hypothetical protein
LTGVSANFFTVAGATSVTHSANSGVIAAVFPATAKAAQTISFTSFPADITYGTSPAGLGAISPSGLTVLFTSATSGVCTVSGTTVTIVSAGTCTINANQVGDANYQAASQVSQSFTIAKASQSITFTTPSAMTVGGSNQTVAPTTSSSLTVTLTSTTTGICTVAGFVITAVSPGTCSITASQAGNTNYEAATDAIRTFSMTGTINTAAITGVTAPVDGATPVTTTTAGTGYTGTVSWASSGGALVGHFAAATIYTATITLTATSGYTLTGVSANFFTVSGASSVTHSANSGVITAVFPATAKTTQATLSITSLTTNTKAYPYSQALSISTSGGSGSGGITFTVASGGSASGCALSDSTATATITATTTGTCRIQATKAADSTYDEITSAAATFIFDKASQSITFTTPSPMTFGGSNQSVTPTASSSLTVTLTSTTTGICTVAGFVITAVGSGTCSITASQAGNSNYLAAVNVVRTFGILKATQSISFTTPSAMTVGGSNQTVAPSASSSLTVTLTSTTTGICTVAGFVITAVSPGTCSITASQAGNTNYQAAANVTRTFAVSGPATAAAITIQPTGAGSGSVLGNQPVIRIIDSGGNTVTNSSVDVVASISSGTGTLSGITTVAASSGIATFTNLAITGTVGTFTLTFTPTSLTATTSNSLTITAGPASKVSITRASVGTQRRTAFTTQPQITIQDVSNNTITSSTAVVNATVSAGGTLVGTTTATASSGIATFNGLGVDGNVGTTYTITYTAEGLTVATATITLTGTTCDGSFTCQVGDTGPGGGTVFYVASTTFTQVGSTGSMCATNCKYLEAAPTTSATFAWTDNVYVWSGNTAAGIGATAQQTAIGTGYANTLAIVGQSNTPNMAGTISQAYRGPNGLSDWFLPSKDELNQLYAQKTIVGGIASWYYWSSSEGSFATTRAWAQSLSNGAQGEFFKSRSDYYVRPIRAFGLPPTTISAPAIAGVTAPVTGATPVTTTTAGTGYTGTVSWSGSPSTFVANTRYTATITLTATSGYTLTGVSANFFTVSGASSVTHSANSGVITAVFYMVNSTGPGGGEIFYVASTPFDCGPTANRKKCTYLEAAPGTWFDGNQDPTLAWAEATPPNLRSESVTTGSAIGSGYQNSLNIVIQGNGATTAAGAARAYTVTVGGVVFNDWFLPSRDELYELYLVRNTFVDLVNSIYWSSTEFNSTNGFAQFFYDATQRNQNKGTARYVRPVRSF